MNEVEKEVKHESMYEVDEEVEHESVYEVDEVISPRYCEVRINENNGVKEQGVKCKYVKGKGVKGKDVKRKVVEGKGEDVGNIQCPWVVLVSKTSSNDYWRVKTFKDTHKCLQSRNVRACTTTCLSNELLDTIEGNLKFLQKLYTRATTKEASSR
nr:hypothetical protein [Tanacetum cinerariifolium]